MEKKLTAAEEMLIQCYNEQVAALLRRIERNQGMQARITAESMLLQHISHKANMHYQGEHRDAFIATLTIMLFNMTQPQRTEQPRPS